MAVGGGHKEPLNEVDYAHLGEVGDVAGSGSSTAGLGGSRICFLRLIASASVIGVIATAVIVAASLQGNVPTPPSQPPYNPAVRLGCTHPVFCTGPLLKAVQVTNLFPDAKTFVDMPIVNIDSPLALANKFLEVQDSMLLPSSTPDSPVYNSSLLRAFVDQYFVAAGSDLTTATPADWQPSPPLLSNNNTIKNDDLRAFALDVNEAWKVLVRKYNNRSQYCEGCLSSLPLPHSFVVPGGRFREFYYWDTYWILNGLLLSGMHDTARDTLYNFFSMVDDYGFIPNGARLYFLDRSQPPLLAEMVALYYNITGDASMVVEAMPRLLAEHRFWMETDHLINISTDFSETAKNRFQGRDVLTNALLNRYYANTTEPRPESWREDIATSAEAPYRDPSDLFSNLAAGAETGWDYSSRWLDNTNNTFYPPDEGTNPLNNPNYNNLSTILTRHLVPVDLNTILLRSEEIIASFLYGNWKDQTQLEQSLFTEFNGVVFDATLAAAAPSLADRDSCAMMATYAQRRRNAIQNILHVDKMGAYSDFNMLSGMYTSESNLGSPLSPPFYASSMLPFSVNTIARFGLSDEQVTKFLNDLTSFIDIGGVPASNISVNTTSGNPQQWDYPNGWAPLQYWAVDALEMIAAVADRPQFIAIQASALRKKIVQAWTTNNYCGYQTPQTLPNGDIVHSLVEKYAVNQDKGVSGHGGEYTVQVGFGWTNGVALNFIVKNGDWLTTGVC